MSEVGRALVGRVVTQLRRARYVFQEQVTSDGPFELTFDDGGALLLDAGPNGQELVLTATEWIDPFAPPMSTENREYVDSHGRWVAFDLSADEDFRAVVGTPALHVKEARNRANELVGLEVGFPKAMLRFTVDSDELFVHVDVSSR